MHIIGAVRLEQPEHDVSLMLQRRFLPVRMQVSCFQQCSPGKELLGRP